jgi:hypothetical protein
MRPRADPWPRASLLQPGESADRLKQLARELRSVNIHWRRRLEQGSLSALVWGLGFDLREKASVGMLCGGNTEPGGSPGWEEEPVRLAAKEIVPSSLSTLRV